MLSFARAKGEDDVDVVKKERSHLKEMRTAEGRKRKEPRVLVKLAYSSLVVGARYSDGSNRYSMNNKNLLQRPCAPIFHPLRRRSISAPVCMGENRGREAKEHSLCIPIEARYRRIGEILANKCIINALQRMIMCIRM